MAIEKIAVEITSNAKNIEKELDSIDKRLAQLNNKKYDLTINAEKLQNARNEISKIDTQMKELQARKAILKTDSAEIVEAKKKLDEINAKMKSLQAEKATIKADATSVEDAKEKVAAIDKQLASLSKNKATIQADVSKVTEAKKEVIDIDAQLKQLSARKATLQVTTTNLKGADTELKNLHKEMESLNNKKARLQISQEDFESSKGRLSGLVQQLTSLNSKTTKVTISDNIDDVANKLDNLGNKLLQPFGGGKFGDMLGLGLAFKGVDKAVSMISGSFGGAVSRLDTLNNFPKTMSNMNISVEQSSAAIEALSDGLTGLPTTVDAAASSVQQFTNKNKDIEKSTGMFLSLNNALIAGGQEAQKQESALNQLSRAYSIGTMDLNTWQSMQQAMPAQLSQVATAFGKSEQALYEALQKGNISMDEFMDKIIELNETGIDGFQSFEEQARNSAGGLRTAMSTMQSAITRGNTAILESFDKILGGGEAGGFAEVFSFIGKQFEDGLKAVAALAEKYGDKIASVFQSIRTTIEEFDFKGFFQGFSDGLKGVGSGFSTVAKFGKPVIDAFGKIISMIGGGSLETGLGRIAGFTITAGIGFKGLSKGLKVFNAVGKPVIGVIGGIGGAIGKLFGRSGGKTPEMPKAFDFGNMFGNLLKNAGNLALVFGAIKVVEAAAQAMKSIDDKVPDDFSSFSKKIGNMAIAITAMGGLMAAAGWLVDKNPEMAIKGLIAVTAISLELMLVAEAISQVDSKIPDDMVSFGKKIGNMAIAIGAMGGLMVAAGYVTKSNPVAAVAGLIAVTAIALELMLVAEAISQVDAKIPDDVASFSKKIANMAIAIGAMGALIGVAGGLMMTGVGAAVAIAGLAAVTAIAWELKYVAEAIRQVDEKVPDNFDQVKGKIDTMVEIIQYFGTAQLGTIGDIFGNLVGLINAAVVAEVINELIGVAENLVRLDQIDVPENIDEKIQEIMKATESLDGSSIREVIGSFLQSKELQQISESVETMIHIAEDLNKIATIELDKAAIEESIQTILDVSDMLAGDNGLGAKIKKFFGSKFDPGIFESMSETINTMIGIARNLNKIAKIELDQSAIEETIQSILDVSDMLAGEDSLKTKLVKFFGSGFDSSTFDNVSESVDTIVKIANDLSALQSVPFDGERVKKKVGEILEVIDLISGDGEESIWGKIAGRFGSGFDSTKFDNMSESVDTIVQIASDLSALQMIRLEGEKAKAKVKSILAVLEELSSGSIEELIGTMIKKAELIKVKDTLVAMLDLEDPLNRMQEMEVNPLNTITRIQGINQIVEALGGSSLGELIGSMIQKSQLVKVKDVLLAMIDLNDPMEQLQSMRIGYSNILTNIRNINGIIEALGGGDLGELISSMIQIHHLDKVKETLNGFLALEDPLIQFRAMEVAPTDTIIRLGHIKTIVEALADPELKEAASSVVSSAALAQVKMSIDQLTVVKNALQNFGSQPLDVAAVSASIDGVKTLLDQIAAFPDYDGVDSINELVNAFSNLVNQLNGLKGKFKDVGANYGKELIRGFKNQKVPRKLLDEINDAIKRLQGRTSEFRKIGEAYGTNLVNGFNSKIRTMTNGVIAQINSMQRLAGNFTSIGHQFATNLMNGFDRQIANLSNSIDYQVRLMQASLNSLNVPDLSGTIMLSTQGGTTAPRPIALSTGGEVPQYRADGGSIFQRRGTDTVPAMLTPGEFVTNRKAVSTYGVEFMKRLNSLDIGGAFQSLTKFNPTKTMQRPNIATTINNVKTTNNTNNARVNQTINGGNQKHAFKRANRYVRNL